jgi:alpha-mannosidase
MSMPTIDPKPGEPDNDTESAPLAESTAEIGTPTEPSPESPTEPITARDGRTFVALIAFNGVEPPASLSDRDALASWCALSAVWHPALLAEVGALPRVDGVDNPSPASPRDVVVVADGQNERLPSGYRTQAEDLGAVVVDGGSDRSELVEAILGRIGRGKPEPGEEGAAVALDFLALGTCWWWLRDLTTGMGHADTLDHENLTREALNGARAWASGDFNGARNRLRAAFELLTQARERFYPVDAYVVDLCLVDPAMPGGVLAGPLAAKAPVTFLAPGAAIEAQAGRDPEHLAKLREAISEGWADVVGGAYAEADEPLLPVESILWQFRRGSEVYREHLDGRNVETLARRRFGLYSQLPQIAKRFAYRFAVHLGFDAGRFPIRSEAKRLWESPDHTSIETLTRPPLAADRAVTGAQLAWRLALTMKDDHVATLPLVHWPSPVAGWYLDLRRVAAYSPVLARWVTLNDYFHLTDRPFESFAPESDEYVTPYLAQAVARRDLEPISRRAAHTRLRARFDALSTVHALAEALGTATTDGPPDTPALSEVENALESGRLDEARTAIERLEPFWAGAAARGVVGEATGGRPGFLVVNPAGIPRRAAVLLPDAAMDLRPEGPLRAAQFTEEGVWAVVELPAFGFAWVPRDSNYEASPAPVGNVSVRDKVLRNEAIGVEIDTSTGGIRGIKGAGEETARLGQQLVVAGLVGPDGQPAASRMRGDEFEVEYGGPALAQAVASGALLGPDDRPLARFRQRFRLWTGRPLLEIDVAFSELDPAWLKALADADPWSHYLGCRWAWPDPSSMLRRTCLLAPELTEADRPETPDALDLSTRRQRTALLFGGLAHHRRHGTRMLDTLLVTGRETARSFKLGVVLDLEHPFQAATDFIAPAFVVPTDAGPPRTGPTGWLFQLDSRAVAVTRVEYVPSAAEGRGWGLAFHMLETAGQPVRCRLRTFRPPSWARQTDFQNDVVVDLPIDGDAVHVDFTPHELARVEVTLG